MRLLKLLMTLVLAVAAFGADINGKWKSTIEFNGQSHDITYTFKVEGRKLTGTVTGPAGDYAITEGIVLGDEFTFSISTDEFDVGYKGTAVGDHLEITLKFGDNMIESIAKRP